MNRQAYVSFEQVLTDMWAPCHMNTIFFEQMLIHQFKLFQALVAINRRAIKSWPAGK